MPRYILNKNRLIEEIKIAPVLKHYFPDWDGRKPLCCPFHKEKTPSFHVHKGNKIARCFGGCGTYDAIQIVREMDNQGFVEALELCAKLNNLEVIYDEKLTEEERKIYQAKEEHRLALLHTNRMVADYYFDQAYPDQSTPKEQRLELDGRTLQWTTIEQFKLCTVTPDKRQLAKAGFELERLKELGLVTGGGLDVFRGRTLFPIQGSTGQIIGFAGRKPASDQNKKNPKYLNSTESEVYKKEQHLYGWYHAQQSIRKLGEVYLVEGYWDVLSLVDGGLNNVVALSGTALSKAQIQLMKRTAQRVIFIADNDADKTNNAGLEAVRKALPSLLEAQLFAEIVLLPDNEDPDSYQRSVGAFEFAAYLKEHREDAVLWYVKDQLAQGASDPFARIGISEDVIQIIKGTNNQHLLDFYATEVPKLLALKKDTFRLDLNKAKRELVEQQSNDGSVEKGLTPAQRKDLQQYQLYHENNRLMARSAGGGHFQIANFIVKPLFHIEGEEPRRLFEVTNVHGVTKLVVTGTQSLVSIGAFMSLTEAYGNYVFTGEPLHYTRLKRRIYDLMGTAKELTILGYDPKTHFWVFGNGLYTEKGFLSANEQGIVVYDKKQYFLPACSSIYEDQEEQFFEEKNLIYTTSTTSFEDWARLFCKVHGKEGQIGIVWMLSALFRSTIMEWVKLPLLNLFGDVGNGKSFFGENLLGVFQQHPTGMNLHAATKVAFFNKMTSIRDGILLFEEYKNALDQDKWEALKDIFDGLGREYGQKTTRRNKRTRILSSAILSGQELPTVDYALFTRCITLQFNFDKDTATEKQKEYGRELMALRGQLSGMMADLTGHRQQVKTHFPKALKAFTKELPEYIQLMGNGADMGSRMIDNNAALLAVYRCLAPVLKFPFSEAELFHNLVDTMQEQQSLIAQENENAQFWQIIEFLAVDGSIHEGQDYRIKFGEGAKIHTLFVTISLARVYQLYREGYRRQHNRQGLSKASLIHYLKNSRAFVEKVASVRLAGRVTSGFAFKYDAIGIALPGAPEPKEDYKGGVQLKMETA